MSTYINGFKNVLFEWLWCDVERYPLLHLFLVGLFVFFFSYIRKILYTIQDYMHCLPIIIIIIIYVCQGWLCNIVKTIYSLSIWFCIIEAIVIYFLEKTFIFNKKTKVWMVWSVHMVLCVWFSVVNKVYLLLLLPWNECVWIKSKFV